MDTQNRTVATELILLGFSNDLNTNLLLFVIFLLIYSICLIANCLILFLVISNSTLHIPMYYFFCMLSVLDLCMTSSVLPKLLVDLISGQRIISLAACTAQFYIILLLAGFEFLLLALMAYDRYVAICRPLHYSVLMRWNNCYRMTALVCILTFIIFGLPCFGSPVNLCYPNQINHFMCEVMGVTQVSCGDIYSKEVKIVIACFLALFLPFSFIMVSYACILSAVLKLRSASQAKAFSTCSSHVMVVLLFYGTSVIMYFGPTTKYSTTYGKYFSLLSNIICPTLNPIIYCLNNKDVKEAQRKFFIKFEHLFSLRRG
ncbi:olfactory receptor 5AR1-like [Dendropsophus ebraccatus]|uniref:olfactory receptor 5AR1-like n=1 Tax=Dendropsophus ebraccatus TaxID=150705 RepID=UPI0038321B83